MKERPILFSAPMVRALLDNTKTQTRRKLSSVVGRGLLTEVQRSTTPGFDIIARDKRMLWNDFTIADLCSRSPYGVPGDRLWVKETWHHGDAWYPSGDVPWKNCHRNGEGTWVDYKATITPEEATELYDSLGFRWKPSIFMPRWASRITLEIASVRVERLQDISGKDAVAEGVNPLNCYGPGCPSGENGCNAKGCYGMREAYRDIWESINGPGSWDANPYVWVVEFRRTEQ